MFDCSYTTWAYDEGRVPYFSLTVLLWWVPTADQNQSDQARSSYFGQVGLSRQGWSESVYLDRGRSTLIGIDLASYTKKIGMSKNIV